MNLIIESARYAADMHHAAGDTYGNQPYWHHLSQVVRILEWSSVTNENALMAGWLHDTLEDTSATKDDLTELFGESVAEIVEACTGRGYNRQTRRQDIRTKLMDPLCNPWARVVKAADRVANMEYSRDSSRSKYKMYLTERDEYLEMVELGVRLAVTKYMTTALMRLQKRLLEA
jgi:(p)ppGpp synthase/HD superfamily hydrolase